jgi:hypothetical protein
MEFREKNVIGKTDFDIICSMFELHKKLPPVAKVLYDGFTLPEKRSSTWLFTECCLEV